MNTNIWGDFQICISVPLRMKTLMLWGFTKKQYKVGGITLKGGFEQFADSRGSLVKKKRWCFWGWYSNAHYVLLMKYTWTNAHYVLLMKYSWNMWNVFYTCTRTQPTITCSKSAKETLKKYVKYVQSYQ